MNSQMDKSEEYVLEWGRRWVTCSTVPRCSLDYYFLSPPCLTHSVPRETGRVIQHCLKRANPNLASFGHLSFRFGWVVDHLFVYPIWLYTIDWKYLILGTSVQWQAIHLDLFPPTIREGLMVKLKESISVGRLYCLYYTIPGLFALDTAFTDLF